MKLLDVQINKAGYEKDADTIRNINFTLEKGELIGLIGPNGAGKSTTIKTVLGLMENVTGTITFSDQVRYSYLPERPIFYDELTLWEHLDFVASVEGLEQEKYKKFAIELLRTYKLEEHAHQLPATYSKGMQQKAMLLLALITEPDIYIIDEPFIGLDPRAMKLFLTSIEEERKRGAGIIMSTHVLDTAEKVCDRFLLVNNGELAASGTLEEIRTKCNLREASLFDCFHLIAEELVHE
ncbi:ABC transporter ATP-binding protein [Bacillus sp. 31A1R]|uniref:ABC transporter ATP-binding protein n=1 Tax=Robertmurraya mangrovi TaxID=3098077 RepID=A0ABU5IZI5_9BACI|nr:ABC transporter ATP-binding protein [Bacillus sp. 31A1R]MDZ5472579.1 ABC transporter ATP-binding protein [Bacillus sp. 31A1R]